MCPHDLPEIYGMADIFVTASEIETQGIVLLEAAASGLPIAAVDATCISESVRDQVNGLLVEPGNINALSRAILELLNNPARLRLMGRQGRFFAAKHDIQHSWFLHENLYQEMIKQSRVENEKHNDTFLNPWKVMKTWMGLN
jgi:glycosyltransferase involved in cell wall biosynthesis